MSLMALQLVIYDSYQMTVSVGFNAFAKQMKQTYFILHRDSIRNLVVYLCVITLFPHLCSLKPDNLANTQWPDRLENVCVFVWMSRCVIRV